MKVISVFLAMFFCNIIGTQAQFLANPVVAHRGAWKAKKLPQNSIASLQEAIRLGCAGSEFDVSLTADEVLVVNHDPTYSGKSVEQNTYAALSENRLPNGENLPKLEDYLKEGMKQHKTKLVLEIKSSVISKKRSLYIAEKVVQLVKELGADDWIMYIAFDYDVAVKIRELDSKADIAYLNGDKTPEQIMLSGINGLDYHFNTYYDNEDWITDAKRRQLHLNVWTVNKSSDMDYFVSRHFNYITTDEPEQLLGKIETSSE